MTKKEVIKFLQKNGVETRFISILDEAIYINNLKLSRFSRKKEELFLENFPDYEVRRSKVFQKICTRASRVLKNAINPRDKIIINGADDCLNLTLHAVLEPYTRKYGVELIFAHEIKIDEGMGIKKIEEAIDKYHGIADSIALPLTIDGEVENMLELMLQGDKLDLLSSRTKKDGVKFVYPLINVPRSWIESWIALDGLKCTMDNQDGLPQEMLEFLESFIPDVREKMMRSATYLSNETGNF